MLPSVIPVGSCPGADRAAPDDLQGLAAGPIAHHFRLSMTRLALPIERSMLLIGTILTSTVTPM